MNTINPNTDTLNDDYQVVHIGLGSNLQNPQQQIQQALDALGKLPDTRALRSSHWYSSKALGPGEQPDYVNAAVYLETRLAPLDLLHALQAIENQQGRQREIRWGARTLDLDILLYQDFILDTPELQLPHPEIMHRNFVLYPLYDLSPQLVFPNGQSLASAIATSNMDDLLRLNTAKAG